MILIFDLDDTLYEEMTYVLSGLRAVARHGEQTYGWNAEESFAFLRQTLEREGRGKIFDRWLEQGGKLNRSNVRNCVKVYRHHRPELRLLPEAEAVLQRYETRAPLYLVTDGHKIAQRNKVEALGLRARFRRCLITHEFGTRNAKPSLYCFELIRRAEKCNWADLVHVGDNPAKDFVNLNRMGALTVRVLTGSHKQAQARPGFDAQHTIASLAELPTLLEQRFAPAQAVA